MSSKLRIIVTGLIAQYPLGGMAWHYLQYVLGLRRLGHDVYYFEDTGQWPYNPREVGTSKSCEFNVEYLSRIMQRFGLSEQWAYRFTWGPKWFGMDEAKRKSTLHTADLVVNVSGTLERPWEYGAKSRLAYVDTDPVFTQLKLARGQKDFRQLVDAHDLHFSFGERLSPCVPETGHQWQPTRQPIVLSEWSSETARRNVFTTIMNWTSHNDVVHDGRTYGQKDLEFRQLIDLPSLVAPTQLEIAVNAGKTRRTPRDLLAHRGWRVVDPGDVCPDLDSYREYIQSSKAEFSSAKHGYVVGRPGWFSERSACYLAAGRPVVTQDTGFATVIPTGNGLLSFTTIEEAADAIDQVEGHYDQHSLAARDIAETYFGSDNVLRHFLDKVFSARPSDRPTDVAASSGLDGSIGT